MTLNLAGKTALVTGAGTGLGREHAMLLAHLGARVVVNDLGGSVNGEGASSAAADSVVAAIVARGGEAVADYGSVTDPAAAKQMVNLAVERFGRIDIVVNNAGILRDRSFAKMTLEDFDAVLKVHLYGAFNVTHAAWPLMLEQKFGRIIMTTSVAGTSGNFGQANYGAAKLGLVGMMNCLAIEGRKHNVLVNAIAPAGLTRMTEAAAGGEVAEFLKSEFVSPAVAWLASDACTETGTIISAFAGYFAKVAFFEGAGIQFDPTDAVTTAMFEDALDSILSLDAARPPAPGVLGDLVPRLQAMGRL